ncbi:hypothetical protein LUI11_38535 [Bradyrhizobium diazoefficiens]|nr:hypothetical protein [Bradyrhizobium diazoefficiens]APO52379.1 hypothetical protein BD122_18945 [Bradyrhizobium diazoefficiens]MCD9298394.1 hypothetical protein [Bradyrhizobium diazoefficiens]MCD9815700.1 hypothetical protein [Bradyrhizobium diazoefficiens]MCD9833633.1 hypothetical protein [Bradyrhizobium diazoefficiens]MCD9852427.1 hypothetical protein [Bradyrhizobium diazoefficiens]
MSASAPLLFKPLPNASNRMKREWKRQMRLWLRDQIDEQHTQLVNYANNSAPTAERFLEKCAIAEARAGNPERLRSLYPHFADCISSPKLRQGRRYPKHKMKSDVAKTAADYARRIRMLWRDQYRKVKRERDETEIGAEQFAIDICEEFFGKEASHLDVDAVKAAAKKSGKHKPGTRKKPRQIAHVAR